MAKGKWWDGEGAEKSPPTWIGARMQQASKQKRSQTVGCEHLQKASSKAGTRTGQGESIKPVWHLSSKQALQLSCGLYISCPVQPMGNQKSWSFMVGGYCAVAKASEYVV